MNPSDPADHAPDHQGPEAEGTALRADGEQADGASSEPKAAKFVFPSGSRPLDGYVIKRGVGRGGFGEVYFATSDAGKEVALKLIRRNLDVELRGVRQCLNLKHPNLVALYDLKTDDAGDQWVVMEYVPLGPGGGMSLEDAIDAHPNGMPERDVLAWMKGIAAGVGYLHSSGIVHRDLKPGNIFKDVTTAGTGGTDFQNEVKIGDYGLAKFISCSRRSGQTESVGTVHYMAPEIANGRYGREVDLYALGIILYEMLTGHVPFEGESIGEVLMKHLTAEPDLSVLRRPYREIVRRLLAKDPSERIASVNELIEQLPGERTVAGPDAPTSGEYPAYEPAGPESDSQADAQGDAFAGDAGPHRDEREPLYGAAADSWQYARRSWHDSSMPPVVKGLIAFVAVAVLVMSLGFSIPLFLGVGVIYFIYYIIWSALARPTPPTPTASRRRPQRPPAASAFDGNGVEANGMVPTSTDAPTEVYRPSAPRPVPPHRRKKVWREAARQELRTKPVRQNAQELLGSMLSAAGLCFVLAGLATMFTTERLGYSPMPWFAWLTVTATLGSWAVLLTNKVTEGRVEDRVPMRGMLLVLGAVVGLVAGGMSIGVPIALPFMDDMGPRIHDSLAREMMGLSSYRQMQTFGGGALVTVGMAAAYFATLFALVRWWRLAEYTRDKRLSLWSVAGCVFAAWLVHIVWWFPQPTGMLVAGIVAVATQLASPWLPPSKREALARGEVA